MLKLIFAGIKNRLFQFSMAAGGVAGKDIALPKPGENLNAGLLKAIQERSSARQYLPGDVPAEDIAAILWAGYGINRPDGKRTVPAALGKDILGLYALLDSGVYYYDARKHLLKCINDKNIKGEVAQQKHVAEAPLVVVLVGKPGAFPGVMGPLEARMGYVNFSAGCASQNMYLVASALGIGTVVMGSIDRDALANNLDLKPEEVPMYIMPFGRCR